MADPGTPTNDLTSERPTTRPAPRKAWIAVALSPWFPGLGHLYAGAPGRAALMWALSQTALVAIFIITVALPPRIGAFAPWLLLVAGLGAVMTDAARTARRASPEFRRRAYNRWYVYLLLPILSGVLVTSRLRAYILKHIFEAFVIPTKSMERTLLAGDYLYATPLRGTVKRGDNVVYRYHGLLFVKRVVALGGDTVAMRNDSLLVNGRRIAEPYAIPSADTAHATEFDQQRTILAYPSDADRYRPTFATWGPLVVPGHAYFLLGDNRGSSLDSRFIGPVDVDSVTKRPIGIYFSRNPESRAIRWDRIGRSVSR